MKLPFATELDHPAYAGEAGGGISMVEMAGYIPADKQIETLIEAGLRLNYARAQQYDIPPGEEDDGSFIDPTRRPDFDLADASALADLAQDRLDEQARLYKEKQEKQAKKDQEDYQKYLDSITKVEDGKPA